MQAIANSSVLLSELREEVLYLKLNRPDKRNALSRELLLCLHDTLDEIAADARARVVVLASEGPVFCAGHDLSEMLGRTEEAYRELFTLCSTVMQHFRSLP